MNNMALDCGTLKTKCPMPALLRRLGLGRHAKASCPSPFRADNHASWGIFHRSSRWMFKDFATGELGDEISLLAKVKQLDVKDDFLRLLEIYDEIARREPVTAEVVKVASESAPERLKPDRSGFGPGTRAQIEKLALLRGFDPDALRCAQAANLLVFGAFREHEVYGITDRTGHVLEVRRLDGELFPAGGGLTERKSHALKGSRKDWPVGIMEASDKPCIALCEGLPDFLALFDLLWRESAFGRVGPVAMLSASCRISSDALPHFKGKHVRLYPHQDEAGRSAAVKWRKQLIGAGVAKVDYFNFAHFQPAETAKPKDLCDFNRYWAAEKQKESILEGDTILP